MLKGKWLLLFVISIVISSTIVACDAISDSSDSAESETAGDVDSMTAPSEDIARVYGKWQTEGHDFFPHWDTWDFLEDGTLVVSSSEAPTEATGVFFINCDYSELSEEQLAAVPRYWEERASSVFSDRCEGWRDDPDLSRGHLVGNDFFSFAYQVDPGEYDSSVDNGHAVMIINFPESDNRMEVVIANLGTEIIMNVFEEPMVFERIE